MPFKKGQSGNPFGRRPLDENKLVARIEREFSHTRVITRRDMVEDAAHQRNEIENLLRNGDIDDRDKAAIRIKLLEIDLRYGLGPKAAKPSQLPQNTDEGPITFILPSENDKQDGDA